MAFVFKLWREQFYKNIIVLIKEKKSFINQRLKYRIKRIWDYQGRKVFY